MDRPLGVPEPIDKQHRKPRFQLLGVPVSYTTFSWLALPVHYLAVLPYTFLKNRLTDAEPLPPAKLAIVAQRHATLALATNYAHSIGHLLAGKAVGAPMDELIITATRQVNRYEGDQSHHSRSTHIARAAGGPLFNALIGVLALVLYRLMDDRVEGLDDLAFFNLGAVAIALLPISTVDGGTILKQLRD